MIDDGFDDLACHDMPRVPESIVREHARTPAPAQDAADYVFEHTNAEEGVVDRNDPHAQKRAKVPLVQGCLNRFPLALMEVAKVSVFGGTKYNKEPGDMSYLDVVDAAVVYRDAEARHMLKEQVEGPINREDGDLYHKAQKAWNALADLEVFLRGRT